jgi:hypothetical protein
MATPFFSMFFIIKTKEKGHRSMISPLFLIGVRGMRFQMKGRA